MCQKILIYYEQRGYGGVDTHMVQLINNWPVCDDRFIVVSNSGNDGLNFFKKQLKNSAVEIIKIYGIFERFDFGNNKIYRILPFVFSQIDFVGREIRAFVGITVLLLLFLEKNKFRFSEILVYLILGIIILFEATLQRSLLNNVISS